MTTINETNVNEIVTTARALFVERVQFEEEMLARTNKGLYEILAKVYALYIKAEKDACLKESVAEMKKVLYERGIKTQKNTKATTVFVRYVFNSDRKRAYNYTQVLDAALKDEIAPNNFAKYVADNNGIEEMKRNKALSEEQQKKRDAFEVAESIVAERLKSMKPMHILNLNGASVDLSDDVSYAFVIARKNKAGDLELLQAVPTSTIAMQNAAIKSLAKQLVSSDSNVDANDLHKEDVKTVKVTVSNEQLQNIKTSSSSFDDAVNSATLAQQ